MKREDVIRMAKEAGWTVLYITWAEPTGEPNWTPFKESMAVPVTLEQVERFAAIVAAAERERCAKVCERIQTKTKYWGPMAGYCAEQIRRNSDEA